MIERARQQAEEAEHTSPEEDVADGDRNVFDALLRQAIPDESRSPSEGTSPQE